MSHLTEILHPADLLDITLVALLVYCIARLIRPVLAVRLLAGICLLFLFFFFARFAGLNALETVLHQVAASLAVIVAVVFHSEIRRALFVYGKKSEQHGKETLRLIREVVSAASLLAERRTGALIVLQRRMEVDPFIEVGTVIDASVSSELLTSIFLPYSPIHDGAVIVRRGKITHAGCFLPLTRNPAIDRGLGTRHRAAIGLTELADAAVVVVSEETGGISVVSEGRLSGFMSAEAAGKMLARLMEPDEERAGHA